MKQDGRLVIGDFGLSKSMDQIRSSSKCDGTYPYISPECFSHGKVTPLSDIWYVLKFTIGLFNFQNIVNYSTFFFPLQNRSFGCILFELIELKKAYNQQSPAGIMNAIVKDSIPVTKSNFDLILKKYKIYFE